jgi:hypothetical protein
MLLSPPSKELPPKDNRSTTSNSTQHWTICAPTPRFADLLRRMGLPQ